MSTKTDIEADSAFRLDIMWHLEPGCESGHIDPRNKVCTVSVVARVGANCLGDDRLACQGQVDFVKWARSMGTMCIHCGGVSTDCWRILPV